MGGGSNSAMLSEAKSLGVPEQVPLPTIANRLPVPDLLAALGLRPSRPMTQTQSHELLGGPVMSGKLGRGPGAGWAGKGVTGGHNQIGGGLIVT